MKTFETDKLFCNNPQYIAIETLAK